MTGPTESRRLEPRNAANVRAVVVAPGLELPAWIVDQSTGGLRLRMDRSLSLPDRVLVVDVQAGVAHEFQTIWRKGQETGGKRLSQVSLRGLVPQRLTAARDAWRRAGGG